jgi:uncharacterized phiE125 gp8 family phage protein
MPEILLIQPAGECLHVDEVRNDRRIDDHADDAKIKSLIVAARQAAESKTRQQFMHARWKLVLDTFPMAGCGSAAPLRSSISIPEFAIRLPHSPLVDVVSIQYLDMAGTWQTMPSTDYVVNTGMTPAIITPAFGKIWPIPMPQIASVAVTYNAGYASPITTGGALSTNQFRVTGPVTWAVGARVNFYNSGGALPASLSPDVTYLIASAANGVYTITDDTGAAVTFTQVGTGRNFIGVVPDGIRSWMLLRVGSLMENREEAVIGNRLTMVEPAFIDGLLDPFRTDLA